VDVPRVRAPRHTSETLLEPELDIHHAEHVLPDELRSILSETTAATIESYMKPYIQPITLSANQPLFSAVRTAHTTAICTCTNHL
jgi:hypothetical protein